MLDKCTKLQELTLIIGSNYQIGDYYPNKDFGIKTLTKSISKLVLLEKLKFSYFNCYLRLTSTSCVFKSIYPLVNLTHLTISL